MSKTMNIGLKIIAWLGFAMLALGNFIALMVTIGSMLNPGQYGVGFAHLYALVLAAIGTPLMLAGGIVGKPKHFWLFCLIIGLLYIIIWTPVTILVLISHIQQTQWDYLMQNGRLFEKIWNDLFPLIPGIIAIAGGIVIRRLDRLTGTK